MAWAFSRTTRVDTEPPSLTGLNITSQPANGEAYDTGEVIIVEATFDENVTSLGDLHLELDVGGVAREATLQVAPGGSFYDKLVFGYTVQEGDADTDGIGISANSLRQNGGGTYDIAGNSASLSHDAVVADSGHKVAAAE